MRKKLIWFGSGVVIILLFIVFITPLIKPAFSNTSVLTEAEVRKIAEERYSSKVSSIEQRDDEYVMQIKRKTGLYELKINAINGQVSSLKKIADPSVAKTVDEKEIPPISELSEEDIRSVALQKNKGEIVSLEKKAEVNGNVYVVAVSDAKTKTILTIDAVSGMILKEEIENTDDAHTRLTKQEAAAIALTETGGTGSIDDIWIQNIDGIAYYIVDVEMGDDSEYIIKINSITGEVKSITMDDDSDDGDDD